MNGRSASGESWLRSPETDAAKARNHGQREPKAFPPGHGPTWRVKIKSRPSDYR